MPLPPQDLRARLAAEIGPAVASDLAAHVDRGAVFLVSPELDLLAVAVAVAVDDASQVETWIARRQLSRPSSAQLMRWSEDAETPLTSVVVQPFVLAQERRREPLC